MQILKENENYLIHQMELLFSDATMFRETNRISTILFVARLLQMFKIFIVSFLIRFLFIYLVVLYWVCVCCIDFTDDCLSLV